MTYWKGLLLVKLTLSNYYIPLSNVWSNVYFRFLKSIYIWVTVQNKRPTNVSLPTDKIVLLYRSTGFFIAAIYHYGYFIFILYSKNTIINWSCFCIDITTNEPTNIVFQKTENGWL